MVLVPFLVSIIAYVYFLQGILKSEAHKFEEDPPTIFSIGMRDALAGYLVFLLWIVFRTGLIGLVVSAVLIAVWIHYFLQFYRDHRKEKRRSVEKSEAPND